MTSTARTAVRTVRSGRISSSQRATLVADVMNEVSQTMAAVAADRQRAEDIRAAKRNRNRMYMLTVTIANTFLAVWFLHAIGLGRILVVFPMAPIVMGFMFDLVLAGWSWYRKL